MRDHRLRENRRDIPHPPASHQLSNDTLIIVPSKGLPTGIPFEEMEQASIRGIPTNTVIQRPRFLVRRHRPPRGLRVDGFDLVGVRWVYGHGAVDREFVQGDVVARGEVVGVEG